MPPLLPPIALLALLPSALAYVLELADSSPALLYSPSLVSADVARTNETWVDWYTSWDGRPPPGKADYVWGMGEGSHTTSLAGASVSVSFAGTRVEWWGRVDAGTTLSTGSGEILPEARSGSYLLAASDVPLGAHNASLTLVSGSLTLTRVQLSLPTQESEWTSELAVPVRNGTANPFFTAPEWHPANPLAGRIWPNLQGQGGKSKLEWLNFSIPANTSVMVINTASDPYETSFDHHVLPGGWLPRVNVQRSWAVPVNATVVFLDPAVKYEYALFPVLKKPVKFQGVSFLAGGQAGSPVLGTSGEVGSEEARVAAEEAGAGKTGVMEQTGTGTGGTGPGASTTSLPAEKGSNTGAIAGGVVGGVVALALLAFGVWLFLRRRRNARRCSPLGKKLDLVESNPPVTPYAELDSTPLKLSPPAIPSTHPTLGAEPQCVPAATVPFRTPSHASPTPINTATMPQPRSLSPGLEDKRANLAPLSAASPGAFASPDMIPSPGSSLPSPDEHELTVHADDAGPVRVDVLPPMYDPAWRSPSPSGRV